MADAAEFDEQALEVLRRIGKGKLLGPMAALFIRNGPERLAAIREAAASGRPAAAAIPAHSLKSSAAQLGAIGLQKACDEIEQAAERGDIASLEVLLATTGPILARALVWVKSKADEEDREQCQQSR